MQFASLIIFTVLGVAMMLIEGRRRSGMIQYPFLAAAVMVGWVLPKAIGLIWLDDLPEGALSKTLLFSSACLMALWLGYRSTGRSPALKSRNLRRNRLLIFSAVLSAIGYLSWLKVGELAPDVQAATGGQWTGVITIYVFFGGLLSVGLAIALVVHVHKPSMLSMGIVIFDLSLVLERVIFQARREVMMEVFIFAMFFAWWRYRWLPPRTLTIGIVFIGALFVNTIGDIRGAIRADERAAIASRLHAVMQLNLIDSFLAGIKDPYASEELRNAVMTIEATDRTLTLDYGAYIWNQFVHQFVPGQIIGRDLKDGLMFPRADLAAKEFGYRGYSVGKTHTGMADAFRSFWIFGAIIFFFIGLIMRRWYVAAERGDPVSQMVILLISTKALLAITHTTPHFFLQFVVISVFLYPVLFLSKATVVFGGRRGRVSPRNLI